MTSSTPGGGSYVYVIGAAGSTRVKIGTSTSPEKRLKELQTGNPDRLEVLWHTPGGRELENLLHQAFAGHRAEGEWFDFGDVQPVGAIPAAVHQRLGNIPRAGRPNPRTTPKRSGARTERGEHLVTPERLACIVRDTVLGLVRPEPEQRQGDAPEEAPVRKRHTAEEAMDRLMTVIYRSTATRHAQRSGAGKTGLAALGGWPGLGLLTALTLIALPVAAFLALRVLTRDVWPVRKLPLLAAAGYILWGPFGFDQLIQDFVLARLPVQDIEHFARTYFTQAAETSTLILVCASLIMCLHGYAQQVGDHRRQRVEAEAASVAGGVPGVAATRDKPRIAVRTPVPQQPPVKSPGPGEFEAVAVPGADSRGVLDGRTDATLGVVSGCEE
ncbi:GIY-YIG nuclease family protein [Streptomyces sp. NPDC057654]|uniref:GIY-YIG nuclease family protein n=1 Tax=Streptomyces sp. NPDC057654 TaxID=3346196 RepID=UPI0036BF14B6